METGQKQTCAKSHYKCDQRGIKTLQKIRLLEEIQKKTKKVTKIDIKKCTKKLEISGKKNVIKKARKKQKKVHKKGETKYENRDKKTIKMRKKAKKRDNECN